jgi:6-phosphogluconolactonase
VPPDHPESNYRMAREALLERVGPAAVHRREGERPPAEAAARYEAALREAAGGGEDPPRLDLVLLGLGADGHTASLFPGSPALEERERWVAAPFVPALGAHRLTLTLPVLGRARAIAYLVSGAGKRGALERLLAPGSPTIPAARVRPLDGALLVLADEAALG